MSAESTPAVAWRTARPRDAVLLILLGLAWLTAALLNGMTPWLDSAYKPGIPADVGFLASTVAAGATTWLLGRRREAWMGTRWLGFGMLVLGVYVLGRWLTHDLLHGAVDEDGFAGEIELLLGVVFGSIIIDFREHVHDDVAEIVSDVVLLAALIGGGIYLLLRGADGAEPVSAATLLTVGVAAAGVLLVAASAVLALWIPSKAHIALFVCSASCAATGILLAWIRQHGVLEGVPTPVSMLGSASLGLLCIVLAVEPRLVKAEPTPVRPALWMRPWLLTISLGGVCVLLGVALVAQRGRASGVEATSLIVVVAALVALRTLGNQRAMTRTTLDLAGALSDRETALASLQDAIAELQSSEARLRLLLDAAVDGVVELAADRTIVRANDAFSAMIGLDPREVLGAGWAEVAARADPSGSLALLLESGQAVLAGGGRTVEIGAERPTDGDGRMVHLEARSSAIPADPPGTLLLVRDVTASRVAEQTIRTLFQFLQDRDEDRTRYLRRTNLAIEAERNRIARDLHDGPIQGVAAASLSVEAVKLMIDHGQQDRAAEMLGTIRRELSEETENLRRLMSDLRPPLLEERGLVPAVRDLCAKFQEHREIRVSVRAACDSAMPQEVETIAYRVVQEALSNVTKHASAQRVIVRIEAARGTLEVVVEDDGVGFDANSMREFLRRGKVGLASMRERTELGGGTFTVRSRQGGGTTVTATLPFDVLVSARS